MAALAPWKPYIKANSGKNTEFFFPVNVNSAGVFTVKLTSKCPYGADLIEYLRQYTAPPGIKFFNKNNELHFQAMNLADITSHLSDKLKEFVNCDEKVDYVIAYEYSSRVRYWKSDNGEVRQNAANLPENETGKWIGENRSYSFDKGLFSVGVGATCLKKTTYTGNGQVAVKYSSAFRDTNIGEYGNLLNDWSVSIEPSPHRNNDSVKIIPYTEEAARFFYELMKSLCILSDKFMETFGDEEKTIAFINLYISGKQFMLPVGEDRHNQI